MIDGAGSLPGARLLGDDRGRLSPRDLPRRAVDEASREHPIEHVAATRERAAEVPPRLRRRGRLRNAREERGLGHGHHRRAVAEVRLARALDALDAVAEGEAVQVLLQDLVLRERALEGHRAEGLDGLRPDAPAAVDPLDELLRDGRRARPARAGHHVARHRAREGAPVDAVVAVKITVLRGDHGGDEVGRDLREPHPAAVCAVDAREAEGASRAVCDDHRVVGVGEARAVDERARRDQRPAHADEHQHRERDGDRTTLQTSPKPRARGREGHWPLPAIRREGRGGSPHEHDQGSTVRVIAALRASCDGW